MMSHNLETAQYRLVSTIGAFLFSILDGQFVRVCKLPMCVCWQCSKQDVQVSVRGNED